MSSSSDSDDGLNPTRITNRVKCTTSFLSIIEKTKLGLRKSMIDDLIAFKSYSSFDVFRVQDHALRTELGGIFNLEFSNDGKILVAACEGKQILLFDASNQKLTTTVENAHQNCVNCVRFLNDRYFATCSDDTSIKIWDIRKVQTCVKTLHGHSNWVKNIEWSEKEELMVTSAFDGSIYAWNLLSPNESNMCYDKVFLMNGLMRMKLTNDSTKMVISTTNGYMMIIHDLDLSTLATDLRFFKPSLYRLMQLSDQCLPVAAIYNSLFSVTRKRNRVEFIADFPNDAEAISSLQIHPHGWNAISRNMNDKDEEEWTSVHDIQTRDPKDYENAFSYINEDLLNEEDSDDDRNSRPTDLWMGYSSLEDYNSHNGMQSNENPAMGLLNTGLIGVNSSFDTYFSQHPEQQHRIVKNIPRLTHFMQEKYVGKGFIKELCYSSDGRIICSPYDEGMRLLGFSDKCQELSVCVPDTPKQLRTIVEMNHYHKDVVVSCKFSPVHYQLVTGCLGSEIKWYQPVL